MRVRSYLRTILCIFSIVCAGETWASYMDKVLLDNPVAYYRFEETSGSAANDSSVNSNSGSYVNGVLLNQPSFSSQSGRSASFDGSNDYVDTPRTVAGNFTLEAWINTSASSLTGSQAVNGNGILWSDVSGGADDFVMAILNNQLAFATGNPDTTVSGGPLLNDGRWHHLVGTRQQGGNIEIYVDGVYIGSASTNNNVLTANPSIHIGGNTLDSRYFNGRIDEVAYYPGVLSPDRIRAHYNAAFDPPTSVPTMTEWGMIVYILLAGLGPAYYLRRQRRA